MPRSAEESVEDKVRRRIRELRRSRGLTQEGLGERSGMSPDAVSRIEAGTRVPTLGTLARLAVGLGVQLHDLVDVTAPNPARSPRLVERIATLVEGETEHVQRAALAIVQALTKSLRTPTRRARAKR